MLNLKIQLRALVAVVLKS